MYTQKHIILFLCSLSTSYVVFANYCVMFSTFVFRAEQLYFLYSIFVSIRPPMFEVCLNALAFDYCIDRTLLRNFIPKTIFSFDFSVVFESGPHPKPLYLTKL